MSAVVVTYNSAPYLERCIKSLWAAGITDIIVVDNASTDHSVRNGRRLGVLVIQQSENRGFGAGCNIGLSLIRNETALLINPDAYLLPHAATRAYRTMHEDPLVAVVGLRLTNKQGDDEVMSYGLVDVTVRELWRRRQRKASPLQQESEVAWVSGGACLVRRAAWQRIGGFDASFFLYWEDVDLCKRLRQRGWSIKYLPQAQVIHERGASQIGRPEQTRHYDTSADRYFRKHYATPIWIFQRLLRYLYRFYSPQVR